ncbi:ankyrin repeat domain-containing protein [Chitinophaga sp. Hz27]|uniref:ankyrin repeat domain-containing protein n=1 Tax=Chitinophaga sp. Hz27 TaxID=3347169 RepID=UPI0035D92EA4
MDFLLILATVSRKLSVTIVTLKCMQNNKLTKFKNFLGYDGKKYNKEKALEILNEIGVNATNEIGETPLIIAAYLGRIDILNFIISQVENVDYKVEGQTTESALLEACAQRRLECIKLLIEHGAALEQLDRYGHTPLSKVFTNTFSDPIPAAEYLITQGAKVTDKCIKSGISWNKDRFIEFLERFNISTEQIPNAEDQHSKKDSEPDSLFDVQQLHAFVQQNDYFNAAKLIWQQLVPKSGQAQTVQGELLRSIEKLRDEAQRNGNANFNENCHGRLIAYLKLKLVTSNYFDAAKSLEINHHLKILSSKNTPYLSDDIYDSIVSNIIDWCLKHSALIPHSQDNNLIC